MPDLSANAQAILLLTAPLTVGRRQRSFKPLSAGEYRRLAHRLRELGCEPGDLLSSRTREIFTECRLDLDHDRLTYLLGRGFLLTQALERWRARAIWVTSRADASYPRQFKRRLRDHAPPILYGCGDAGILETGGLAVIGSRDAGEALLEYTEAVGRLTAGARRTLVSGGARGIDQAAMRGALAKGGRVVGVLADSLEKAVLQREYRDAVMDERLVLICPYDPSARFQVGHAMQRNKLIYALADAALAVSSDYEKGGTWAGAVEQLDRLKLVPLFVRPTSEAGRGLEELRARGAVTWPEPTAPEDLGRILDESVNQWKHSSAGRRESRLDVRGESVQGDSAVEPPGPAAASGSAAGGEPTPAGALFARVTELIERMDMPTTEADVAERLQVTKGQAGAWLRRLVETGVMEKLTRPTRYRMVASEFPLFDSRS